MPRGVVFLALVGCGRWGFSPAGGDAARDAADAPAPHDSQADAPRDATADASRDATSGACTKLAISDNFDDGVRDAAWTLLANNPVNVAETGGQLQVMLATSGGSHYGGYDSAAQFDLRGHCMFVTFAGVPTNEALVEMVFSARTAANTSTGFVYHLGELDPFVNTGTFMSFGAITYNAAMHKVLRVREAGGTMTWETSPDGTTFNVLTTQPTPIDVSSVFVVLESGTYGSAPSPGMAAYDDFNSP